MCNYIQKDKIWLYVMGNNVRKARRSSVACHQRQMILLTRLVRLPANEFGRLQGETCLLNFAK